MSSSPEQGHTLRGQLHRQSRERREGDDMDPTEQNQSSSSANRGSDDGRVLKVEDALHYMGLVKTRFFQEPQKHKEFLAILSDFRAWKATTGEVVRRMSILCLDYPDLLHGLDKFLPLRYRTVVSETANTDNTADSQHAQNAVCTSTSSKRSSFIPGQSENQHLRDESRAAHDVRQLQSDNSHSNLVGAIDFPEGYPFSASFRTTGMYIAACNLVDMASSDYETTPISNSSMNGLEFVQNQSLQSAGGSAGPSAVETVNANEFGEAIRFINKVKNRYGEHDIFFKFFYLTLRGYKRDRVVINKMHSLMCELFKFQNDLLTDFNHFVPESILRSASARSAAN